MYSADLYPRSLHGLWNERAGSSSIFKPTSSTRNRADSNQLKRLYAPPLSAYTADFSGPDPLRLEYSLKSRSDGFNRIEDLGPLLCLRNHQMEKVRTTGYSVLRPLGIGRTMEELQFANSQLSHIDDVSANNIAEENSNDGEMNTLPLNLEAANTNSNHEIDLDAQILNADELNSENNDDDDDDDDEYDNDNDNDNNNDEEEEEEEEEEDGDDFLDRDSEPEESNLRARKRSIVTDEEGFMASEVEYQDGYSLLSDTNTNMVMSSGATTGLFSNQAGETRTSTTNPTTAASIRTEEHEFFNENDYSEHDMLVD
ncbi:hypothetical protein KGF56_003422 [Candida oxycetoniae]|uniref:Uncharacterized protein n=1 Tax=Candida oxycetoniae TaxID=497107 RepID=A0AAI9WX20_9ASCO|nr:uncharacterized protein KGF56_003422 [Candida oxycetoniae]KAI3403787.2 hypothetical protein KGF56_003422 [Candida oxycetoniae]